MKIEFQGKWFSVIGRAEERLSITFKEVGTEQVLSVSAYDTWTLRNKLKESVDKIGHQIEPV